MNENIMNENIMKVIETLGGKIKSLEETIKLKDYEIEILRHKIQQEKEKPIADVFVEKIIKEKE
jgi:hypothetical protein